MTEYLIAFNDEWVPDHTVEDLLEKSKVAKALVAEMKAAGVLIFTGGLDDAAPVFSVDASSGTPLFTDGPFIETKEHLGGFASWMWPTRRRRGCGRERSRWPAVGHRRCDASWSPCNLPRFPKGVGRRVDSHVEAERKRGFPAVCGCRRLSSKIASDLHKRRDSMIGRWWPLWSQLDLLRTVCGPLFHWDGGRRLASGSRAAGRFRR